MCGIYGWSVKRNARGVGMSQREALATVLAIGNSMRGDQSWGAYLVDKEGKKETVKQVGDIARAGVAWMGSYPVVMAHTRYATTGTICVDNAHPFTIGDVTLAHNGVIFNHRELAHKYDRKCPVDSMHFAHHLAEGRDLADIEGYGSLEWVRTNEPAIVYLCRLSGGSLTVYGIKNGKGKNVGIAWSSDEAHLKAALGAARLECYPFEPLEEGRIYSAENGRLLIHSKEPKLKLAERPLYDPRWTTYRAITSGARVSAWRDARDRQTITDGHGSAYRWDEDGESWREIESFPNEEEEDRDLYERLAREDFERVCEPHDPHDPDIDAGLDRLAGLTPVDGGMWVNEAGEIVELDEAEEKLWIAGAKSAATH